MNDLFTLILTVTALFPDVGAGAVSIDKIDFKSAKVCEAAAMRLREGNSWSRSKKDAKGLPIVTLIYSVAKATCVTRGDT